MSGKKPKYIRVGVQKKEHLNSSTYPPAATFYNKAGQTKMKAETDPDKKETGNFQAEFSDS